MKDERETEKHLQSDPGDLFNCLEPKEFYIKMAFQWRKKYVEMEEYLKKKIDVLELHVDGRMADQKKSISIQTTLEAKIDDRDQKILALQNKNSIINMKCQGAMENLNHHIKNSKAPLLAEIEVKTALI